MQGEGERTNATIMSTSSQPNFLMRSFAMTLRPMMTMAMAVSAHTSRSSLGPASYGVSADEGIVSAGSLPGSKPKEDGG